MGALQHSRNYNFSEKRPEKTMTQGFEAPPIALRGLAAPTYATAYAFFTNIIVIRILVSNKYHLHIPFFLLEIVLTLIIRLL